MGLHQYVAAETQFCLSLRESNLTETTIFTLWFNESNYFSYLDVRRTIARDSSVILFKFEALLQTVITSVTKVNWTEVWIYLLVWTKVSSCWWAWKNKVIIYFGYIVKEGAFARIWFLQSPVQKINGQGSNYTKAMEATASVSQPMALVP